jgi:hypothetical protein
MTDGKTIKRVALKSAPRTVQLRHSETPPQIVKPKRLHPRRVLPFVKEGKERDIHDYRSWPAPILLPAAMAAPARAAGDELAVVRNTQLTAPAQQLTSSNVGEPSVAVNDQVVFYTGNWYAAFSPDGGRTFRFIDPKTTAQPSDPPDRQFCCDQVVHYIRDIDTFVWLLQYGPDQDNIQRLGFAKTADVAASNWRFFDVGTDTLDVRGAFLDFPDLAISKRFLYVTTNIFRGNEVGSAVVRIPIDSIDSGEVVADPFVRMDFQSFRVAQNCRDVAFFAAHQDTSTLAVFSWPDDDNAPAPKPVGVARWIGGNGYQSRTPDGRRWLDRADPRITGATLAGSDLWFAWSVDRRSNHRDQPFAQIAKINSPDLTLLENINVFDSQSAVAYPALSSNAEDEVGISYAIGGAQAPSHVVGILTNSRRDQMVAEGNRSPLPDPNTGKGEWGDYLTVRPVFPDCKLFAAAGYVMAGTVDHQNVDATPHFVIFGRQRVSGGPAPSPAGEVTEAGVTPVVVEEPGGEVEGIGVAPAPTSVGHGPISDVNTLRPVKASVAAAIRAACLAAGEARAFAQPLAPRLVTKPGVERWPVKTGGDDDVALVGKNLIAGKNFGAGIVETTVEELIAFPRPPEMADVNRLNPDFQSKRALPVEIVIWRVKATITVLKLEADGDYHLVLMGASGETMVGEIPTPTKKFLEDSPWLLNIKVARQAVDNKLVHHISPHDFVLSPNGMMVPRESLSAPPVGAMAHFRLPESFQTPPEGQEMTMMTFKTKVPATPATVTGVGFFDKVHGQTGVSQSNGIELHPILKIEFS